MIDSKRKFILIFFLNQLTIALVFTAVCWLIELYYFEQEKGSEVLLLNVTSVFFGSMVSLLMALGFYGYLFKYGVNLFKSQFGQLIIAQLIKLSIFIVLLYFVFVTFNLKPVQFFIGFIVLQLSALITLINTRKIF